MAVQSLTSSDLIPRLLDLREIELPEIHGSRDGRLLVECIDRIRSRRKRWETPHIPISHIDNYLALDLLSSVRVPQRCRPWFDIKVSVIRFCRNGHWSCHRP